MSTRSSARNLVPPLKDPERTVRRRNRGDLALLIKFEEINMANNNQNNLDQPPSEGPNMPALDLRKIKELCQPTLNGRGGLIAPIAIQANEFRLKHHMIQQQIGVTGDALRLYLFPYSLTHHATAWFDHLPRNSILSFDQMATKFLSKYFPPSMVTKLRNEITNFCQLPNEWLFEAWERYKLSIDQCPNHNMLPVTQIDTFYNGLTLRHRDTINAAAGGTFMRRRPKECCNLIENMTTQHNDWDTTVQRDTFYNGLTLRHRDTINAAAGGTFMRRRPKECCNLIENMTTQHNDWDTIVQRGESCSSLTYSNAEIAALKNEMSEMNKNFLRMFQNQQIIYMTPQWSPSGV
nr:reverse transcriptase domain-containing protein [Tanacetum cinerariifolium]